MAVKSVNIADEQELEKVISAIEEYVKTAVSEKRFEHSLRTAQTAQKMCSLYGLNPRLGYLAGIAHDMCKEITGEEMLELVHMDGKSVSILEQNKPSLLHGRAAAVLIQTKFGVKDADICEAIACHTFAAKDLCPLGKILFAADKIEPGRPQSTDEYRANLFAKSLDELTLSVLEENIEYLEKRGKKVASPSFELAAQLKENRSHK
jgi:nicotinate-nucleotide adenylyltransferase